MNPDGPALLLEMIEALRQPNLNDSDLVKVFEPRLNMLVAGLVPAPPAIGRKLLAIHGWLEILRQPGALQQYAGVGYARSFLLADCAVLECFLAGPPDAELPAGTSLN